MDITTHLNINVLMLLGFKYNGGFWSHGHEDRFAIKFEPTCFYISFHGYLAKHPYELTVGDLEKQFYERTGKLLF